MAPPAGSKPSPPILAIVAVCLFHMASIGLGGLAVSLLAGDGLGDLARFFANGGLAMRLILGAAALEATLAMGLGIVHVWWRPLPVAVHFVLPLTIVGLGILGVNWGIAEIVLAVESAPAEYLGGAWARGMSIAEIPKVFGLLMATGASAPILAIVGISVHRWRASDDAKLAGAAVDAAVIGGLVPALAMLALGWALAELGAIEVLEAYANAGPETAIDLAIASGVETRELGLKVMRLGPLVALTLWAAMLVWARAALRSGKKVSVLISAAIVGFSIAGLAALDAQGQRLIRPTQGLDYPEAVAQVLGDAEAAAIASEARPVPEGPRIGKWHEHGRGPLAHGRAVAVAPDGQLFIAGHNDSDATSFVSCVDVYGEVVWTETWETNSTRERVELAVTRGGQVVVYGWDITDYDEFHVFEGDGSARGEPWRVTDDSSHAFALGPQDHIYLLGKNPAVFEALVAAPANEDEDAEPPPTPPEELVQAWDLDGVSTRRIELSVEHGLGSLAIGDDGSVYVAGHSIRGTGKLWPGELAEQGVEPDAASEQPVRHYLFTPTLARYDADGVQVWTQTWGNSSCTVLDLLLDADGGVHVLGTVDGSITGEVPPDGPDHIYIASTTAAGAPVKLQQFGTEAGDSPRRLMRSGERLWVTGTTEGQLAGPARPESLTAFLIGRGLDGQAGPIHTWSEDESNRIYDAAPTSTGSVYLVGTASTQVSTFVDSKWSFLLRFDL